MTHHNLQPPQRLTDEVKVFEIANGLVCRVRVRSFDLGNEVAVLFTQNRNPELYPGSEVVNRGKSITNMAEQLVFLARYAWQLVPDGKIARFYEHYCGLPSSRANNLEDSTLAEITVPEGFDKVMPVSRFIRWVSSQSEMDGEMILRVTQSGSWPTPGWRHVSIGDGEKFLGIPLSYSPMTSTEGEKS